MGHTNSIVLNGKLYDAVTGKLIHDQTRHAPAAPRPKVHKKSGLVMDGVVNHKPKKAASHHLNKRRHVAAKPKAHPSTAARPAPHRQPVAAKRHQPQRAATLMRHSVAKPKPVHHKTAEDHHEAKHLRDARIAQRLERAKATQKSHHIRRFNHHATSQAPKPVVKKHAELDVEDAPDNHAHHHAAPAHAPAVALSASERLVANALKNAHAHEAHDAYKHPKRRLHHKLGLSRKAANLAMSSLAVLLLAGFFVYQNIPNFSMRLASSRAGFSAQQPGYSPVGFAQDKLVSYSPGKVTISFHSNSDDREYQLTQQVSNWNSQALADNYLIKEGKQYQTYESNGKTVYVYDGSHATWVNGGVWYQIGGQSGLSSEQLLRIANSI